MARLERLLNEVVMGLLALTALALALAPQVFELPAGWLRACDVADWVIIGLFALEYVVALARASDRLRHASNPWRLLDLFIVVVPLSTWVLPVSEFVHAAPALRLLRLLRMVLYSARMGQGMQPRSNNVPPPAPSGPPEVSILDSDDSAPRSVEWSALLAWLAAPTPAWVHVSNLPAEELPAVAAALGVPHVVVEAALHESSFPRIEPGRPWTALNLSLPSVEDLAHRDPLLLLVAKHSLLSLVLRPIALIEMPLSAENLPWGPRCALQIARRVLDRNEALAARIERDVRDLGEVPDDESPESFFKQAFLLKRALSTAKGDLWRLHAVMEALDEGRRTLPGLDPGVHPVVHELAEEADYLFETVDSVREAILSLLDLHLNIAAHQTNRFMRLLAIVSVLALIPAVTGGLLGMNLSDSPWPVTLGQVAFITLMLMLGVLYTFMAKGWLR